MNFTKQIEGVPLALVQQGFRRQPPEAEWFEWQLEGPHGARWQPAPNFKAQRFCRPVTLVEGVEVYAHQGWRDGLDPTAEMAKIWPHWWALRTNGMLDTIAVFALGNVVLDVHAGHLYPIKEWLGPILPPVMPFQS